MYKTKNYENLQKRIFDGAGEYGILQIHPTQYKECEWIGFNYARSEKNRAGKGIHFFLDDYRHLFQVQGEKAADRSRANPKERLQYLAAGTAAAQRGTGYGTITDRAAGKSTPVTNYNTK